MDSNDEELVTRRVLNTTSDVTGHWEVESTVIDNHHRSTTVHNSHLGTTGT